MNRNRKRILIAVLAIFALAAGGAAFTAEVGGVPSTEVAGFHQDAITGAYANQDTWTYSSDGQYVNSVTLKLDTQNAQGGDSHTLLTGATVQAGFDQGTTSHGVLTPTQDGLGSVDATLFPCPETVADTSGIYVCDYTANGTQLGVPIQLASIFNVQVTKPGAP